VLICNARHFPKIVDHLVIEVVMNKVFSIVLLIAVMSGCSSVINNSERFYQEHPRGRINWREYMTD
jgi:hypothetical protein